MQIMRAVVALSSVAITLLFTQCVATRKTESLKAKVDSSAALNIHKNLSDNSTLINNSTAVGNSVTQDTTAETIITVTYSKPDSTGKQHIETLTTVERNKGARKNNNTTTTISQSKQLDIDIEEDSKVKVSKREQSEACSSQSVKTKTPLWVWTSAALISIGLIVLAYLVLKRYRIVK